MTKPRRYRSLNPEERRLWAHVARGVTPMRGRAVPAEPEPVPPVPSAVPSESPPDPDPSRPRPAPSPRVPPLAPVERKTLLALRRGSRSVDGVMDLHGLRQAEAHDALLGFLRRSQASGHGLVLVITGKGAAGAGAPFDERGVLRRVVPHWLRLPDLRSLVLGFEEASPHHGGSGALYVRLRRRRGGGQDR
jgi:DNA-nicking Smr family endonuclease